MVKEKVIWSRFEDKVKGFLRSGQYSIPQVVGFIYDLYQDYEIDEPEEEYLFDIADPDEQYNECYEYWCAWPYDNPLLK